MLPGINSDSLAPCTQPSTLVPQILTTANNLETMKWIECLPRHMHPLNTHISYKHNLHKIIRSVTSIMINMYLSHYDWTWYLFTTKRHKITKTPMFIFQMNMNCGDTCAIVTKVTSNIQVAIFTLCHFWLHCMDTDKMKASNLHMNLMDAMPSSTVLRTAVT